MYSRGVQTTYTYRSSTFATECNIEAYSDGPYLFNILGKTHLIQFQTCLCHEKDEEKARFENDKLDTSLQRGCVSEANRNLSHSFWSKVFDVLGEIRQLLLLFDKSELKLEEKGKDDRNCYLAISQSQSSRHFWCIFSKCYYVTFVLCSTYGWFSNVSFYTAVAFPFFHKCLYVSLLSFMLTIVVVAIYIHRVMFIRRKRRRRQSKEQ